MNIALFKHKYILKKYSFILIAVLYCSCSFNINNNKALINFNKVKHDFGVIPCEKEAVCSFEFTNPGKTMLIINDVKPSCGCTVPEWSKEPIRPGGKGQIKIKYDAAFPGVFHKSIAVFYNGGGSPDSLEIKGEVESPKVDQL